MRLKAWMLVVLLSLVPTAFAAAATQPAPEPPTTSAATTGPVVSIDAMTATIFQKNQSSFSGIALRAQIHPPQLIQQVSLMPTIEYWRNSGKISSGGLDLDYARKDATLGVDARFDIATTNFKPYLGVGFGLHFLSVDVDSPSLPANQGEDSLIKGGLAALAGVRFGLAGKLDNLIELKYHHIPDWGQFKINFGLSYNL
jgi:opacity protein-like surface antigen